MEFFLGLKIHSAMRILLYFFFSKIISIIFKGKSSSLNFPLYLFRESAIRNLTGITFNSLPLSLLLTGAREILPLPTRRWPCFAQINISMTCDSCTLVTSHSSTLAISDEHNYVSSSHLVSIYLEVCWPVIFSSIKTPQQSIYCCCDLLLFGTLK